MKFKRSVMFILLFAFIFALAPAEFAFGDAEENAAKYKALKEEKSSYEAENKSLKNDLAQAEARLKEAEAKLNQTQRELEQARKDLTQLQLTGKTSKKQIAGQIHKINKLEADNVNLEKAVRKERATVSEQDEKIKRLEQKISELEAKIKELEAQQDVESDEKIVWHPKATCQIIKWDFKPGDRAVKLTILYKKSGKTQQVSAAKHGSNPEREDVYFLISKLPQGLQLTLPDGWTVNVDSRKDYVKMILNPDNIEHSQLTDANDHKEGGGKTFTSGEAIILNKQGGMTIRPPVL